MRPLAEFQTEKMGGQRNQLVMVLMSFELAFGYAVVVA
jgi:hypothetical protein